MSSTNEELAPATKTRASPLDFRNTDLVSRLLAATPPYLYNMPMVPNSYFFSEMLRSFVQAKAEATRAAAPVHHRRSRKRSWTQVRSEMYQKEPPKAEKPEVPSPNWGHKSPEKSPYYDHKRPELPLELTMEKPPGGKLTDMEYQTHKMIQSPPTMHPMEKTGMPSTHMPMMFPSMPQNVSQEQNQNLILPPPPPIWYPPLYPAPYGIDPLHFFIDLRVSGHIYDRKNGKDGPSPVPNQQPPAHTEINQNHEKVVEADPRDGFKQSRHASAFSVPTPSLAKNGPINLSSNNAEHKENKPLKFDVKSMGFEKTYNKLSTNYIMNNIGRIYKELDERNHVEYKEEPEDTKNDVNEAREVADDGAIREETEEEREKRVKDLRALIGLELVVDYMNHVKPGQQVQMSDDSASGVDSSPSPTLEVVAVQEEFHQVL